MLLLRNFKKTLWTFDISRAGGMVFSRFDAGIGIVIVLCEKYVLLLSTIRL